MRCAAGGSIAARLAAPLRAAPSVHARAVRRAGGVRVRASSEVRLVGGLAAEVHGECSVPPARTVLVLPGNPGVVAYYEHFCAALRAELGADTSVCALGLLGHSRAPLHQRTFDLEDQLAHVLRFVDSAPAPVHLVGHSIGAYLALRVQAARPAVRSVVGLYPFLQTNAGSPVQRVLAAAVRVRPLVWLVARLAALLAALPARVRGALLRPVLRAGFGLSDDAVAVSCDWLRAASVHNTCELGAAEFAALAQPPDWQSLRKHAPRVALYYGPPDDFWAPPEHAAAVRQQAPGVTVHTDAAHGHMFCTTPNGSRHVAAATAAMLRAMERAPVPAAAGAQTGGVV